MSSYDFIVQYIHTHIHTQVNSSWSAGDYERAKKNSKIALCWSVAAIVVGIMIVLAVITAGFTFVFYFFISIISRLELNLSEPLSNGTHY